MARSLSKTQSYGLCSTGDFLLACSLCICDICHITHNCSTLAQMNIHTMHLNASMCLHFVIRAVKGRLLQIAHFSAAAGYNFLFC